MNGPRGKSAVIGMRACVRSLSRALGVFCVEGRVAASLLSPSACFVLYQKCGRRCGYVRLGYIAETRERGRAQINMRSLRIGWFLLRLRGDALHNSPFLIRSECPWAASLSTHLPSRHVSTTPTLSHHAYFKWTEIAPVSDQHCTAIRSRLQSQKLP